MDHQAPPLCRDYERLDIHHEAMVTCAMTIVMSRRQHAQHPSERLNNQFLDSHSAVPTTPVSDRRS